MPQQPSGLTALGLLGHRPWAILDRNALRNSVIGILVHMVLNLTQIYDSKFMKRLSLLIYKECEMLFFGKK